MQKFPGRGTPHFPRTPQILMASAHEIQQEYDAIRICN